MHKYYYFNNKNYPIYVTDNTIKITPATFHPNGTLWEEKSIYNFYKCIMPNEKYNIIDIGAQTGLYTLYAKYLPNSTFYAFEPFFETFQELNNNIKLNSITNTKTFNFAISDKICIKNLQVCMSHNGLHTLGNNVKRFDDIKTIEVECHTIDELFFEKNIPVHFIKIDTEGHEYYILNGAINTIKTYKPLIQLEWNTINMEQCNVNVTDLQNFIEKINYEIIDKTDEEVLIRSKI